MKFFDHSRKGAVNQSEMVWTYTRACIIILVITQLLFALVTVNMIMIGQQTKNQVALTEAANQFLDGSAYLTNEVRAYAATGEKVHYDNYWREVNEDKNREIGYAAMVDIGITDKEQKMIDEMSKISNELVPLEKNAMKNVEAGNMKAALDYVYGDSYAMQIAKIHTLQADFISALKDRTGKRLTFMTIGNILLAILAIGALFVSMYILKRTYHFLREQIIQPVLMVRDQCLRLAEGDLTTRIQLKEDETELGMLVSGINHTQSNLKLYIQEIERLLQELAKGNLNIRSQVKFKGDFVQISHAIESFLEKINEIILHIRSSAEQVALSSDELFKGAQSLAIASTEQAEGIEELNIAIDKISKNVTHSAQGIENTYRSTKQINVEVENSNKKMTQMLEAMQEISQQSEAIKDIIQTIEDIAFQTNILSLNAAIEAERAGESGKGFSVVAQEVGKLANQTSSSVKNTTELIQLSLKAVKHGSEIAQETAQSMQNVVNGTKEIEETIEHIASTSTQESEAISQISKEVHHIASVIESNSATSEEAAASSQELSRQSDKMKQLIEQFQLKS